MDHSDDDLFDERTALVIARLKYQVATLEKDFDRLKIEIKESKEEAKKDMEFLHSLAGAPKIIKWILAVIAGAVGIYSTLVGFGVHK